MKSVSPVIETHQLSVGIGATTFCRELNLSLSPGERLGILGRNGAGKSTLLSVLAGIRAPTAGHVLLNNSTYHQLGARRSALIRSWLPQTRGDAFSSTVMETALIGRHPHLDRWAWESAADMAIVRAALADMDLTGLEDRDIRTLSGGERQRLAMAALIAQAPQLFLLDEPVAFLDLKHQISVLERFSRSASENQATVVMVLHEPALAWRFCDQVLLIHGNGTVELGPSKDLLTAERLSVLYQYRMRTVTYPGGVTFIPD